MPEVSRDATILIATSWQALTRAIGQSRDTLLCDCTIVILFAGFFIEANLNDLIERLGQEHQMTAFLNNNPHPGLQDKLAWFYNEYVARRKARNKSELVKNRIYRKIRRKFPGFAELYRFRNDISHGVINRTAGSLEKTKKLRQHAKVMVESLFDIAGKAGHHIERRTTYWEAIAS